MLPALMAKNSRGRPNVRHGSQLCQSGWLEDGDAKALALQHPAEDRHREAGMIDVGIAGDEDDVDLVPAARSHLGAGHRQWPGGRGRGGMPSMVLPLPRRRTGRAGALGLQEEKNSSIRRLTSGAFS